MDSKEATSHPVSEAISGYSTYSSQSSYSDSSRNETFFSKTIVLDDDNSRNDGKGTVSEDEGYVSGNEEFEPALDKPVLDGDANSDASANVDSLPISGVIVNGGDDVEKGDKDIEGDENDVEDSEGFKFSEVEGFDMNGEIIDSVEKLGVKSDEVESYGEGGVEEVEIKGEEFEKKSKIESPSSGDGVSEKQAKPIESEVSDTGDVKTTPEGDSVIDTIQIDVDGPGVVVVGETKENGDILNKLEEEVVTEVASPGVAIVGEKEENGNVVNKLKEEVVTEVASPVLAVVGEMEENGGVVDEPAEGVVPEVAAIEPKNSELVSLVDANTTEEDSVVDTIKVDVSGPGVAVAGEKEENLAAVDEIKPKEVAEAVDVGDVSLTPEGDSVVDTIQVDRVGPGVAVVGEMEGNGGEKIEGVDVPLIPVGGHSESGDVVEEEVSTSEVVVGFQSSEPAAANTVDVVVEKENDNSDAVTVVDLVNGVHSSVMSNDSVDSGGTLDAAPVSEAIENGISTKISTNREAGIVDEDNGLADGVLDEPKGNGVAAVAEAVLDPQEEIKEEEDDMDEKAQPGDSMSEDGDSDGMIFGSSEAAKKFIEELERESGGDSLTGADSSLDQSQRIDGQIVTDSEDEEGDETDDDEGDGKELFDSAALAALLKAASGANSDGGNITITSRDGSRLFSVERPAGLGSSLQSLRPAANRQNRPSLFSSVTPAGGGESEESLSEEERKKLEKLQQIRVKFLRLVHRLGLSPEESVAAQVLYRLALLGGRQGTHTFSLDAAKRTAMQLEAEGTDDLDFSVNILALGKSGVGKSATINSVFGEEKAPIDAFETGTASAREISGLVDGVKVRVVDSPGLKSSVMEQGVNRGILSSIKKFTKKSPPDVVLYVDRLDAQSRDLNDLPLLKTVTGSLGASIWRSAIVTLTHAASAPPDGPSGAPLSYEVFVSQRSHVVQQSIGQAVGDLRMMSPSLMNPVCLVENHPSCRKNREGQKILPNGQSWRPQLLLLCYSMKILSEASSLSKPQDPFDHRKLFGFRARAPPLPYMLSSMLQSRTHPKLQSDQGGDGVDSDIDLDDFSDSDQEEVDEYDQLPPFRPLRKAQIAKLTREQKKAYLEEYDYRVKLLQKKQWKEELRRMREIKKNGGRDVAMDYGFAEDEADNGAAAPVAVPLPDMALPPSFDGDNPAFRYRFLEPTSQFLARPVLDNHGWDHDCGYDGVNLEHSLAIASRFPAVYTVQITKDKKDFSVSLDSSVSAKHGENMSTMAGFDIQSMGKQLAYIVRAETKFKNLKKNRATGGVSFTFLGDNVIPGVKIEDQITLGKQYALVGSAGAVRSQQDTAYGANFELQRRELDYPIGQVQSTLSMSVVKWRGDLALGFNSLAQFTIGRNSKVAVRAGINNKMSGQITVRTSSSEHLSLALTAIIPTALSIYKKFVAGAGEKYSVY